jgi:tetratricopeptide (TPR) repeat protein
VGQWLGAVAAIEVLRTSSQVPPSVNLLLDVSMLHLVRIVGETFPAPHVASTADASVEAAIASASSRSPAVQLAVVRMLFDLGRADEARTLLERVAGSVTSDAERATVLYLRGVLTRRAGDSTQALALYREALALDATRADAAVNATRLLLESGTPESLAEVPKILAAVPVGSRSPELLVNEAAYLAATGQRAAARGLLERVLHITGGAGQVGKLALSALHELGR